MVFYAPPGGVSAREQYLGRLRELGYPEHLVTGIGWNLDDESSGNPAAIGDNGNARGFLQWNGPRARALDAFARQRGTTWQDPILQADFTDYENRTSERAAFEAAWAAPDANTAATIWVNQWERPAEEHARRRTAKYTGGNMGAASGGGGGGATMSSRGGGGLPGFFPEADPDLPSVEELRAQGYTDEEIQTIMMSSGAPRQPATWRDRLAMGLMAGGEALGSLGAGHAPTFEATDTFLKNQQLMGIRRMQELQRRGEDAPVSVEGAVAQLTQMGRADLAGMVARGDMETQKAFEIALGDAPVPGQELSNAQVETANQFRDEYNVQTTPLRAVAGIASNILAAERAGGKLGDAVLVQQFAKMLDPISVVREGEVAAVNSAAGGLESYINGLLAYMDTHNDVLEDDDRQKLIQLTEDLYNASRTQGQNAYNHYTGLAGKQRIGPEWIGSDFKTAFPDLDTAPSAEEMADELGLE